MADEKLPSNAASAGDSVPAGDLSDMPEAFHAARGPKPSIFGQEGSPRREAAGVAVILAIALGVRLLFTYQVYTSGFVSLSELMQGTDMARYDETARAVLAYGWYDRSADQSPLYPYVVLPLFYKLTGSHIPWALALQGILDTVTVLFIYLITRRLFGRRAPVYAALAAAIYAPFVIYQGQLLSESALNFFVAAFFAVMLGGKGAPGMRRAAAAGALLGLAAAAKPTALVFAPLALVWMWQRAGWKIKLVALPAVAGLAAAAAVLAPFAYRNYRSAGEWQLVRGNSGIMLYMGNNPSANGSFKYPSGPYADYLEARTAGLPLSQKDRIYRDAAFAFMRREPGQFARLLYTKFRLFFAAPEIPNNISERLFRQTTFLKSAFFLSFGLVLPFAAIGFLLSMARRGVWFVAASVAAYAAAVILFVVVGRYRLAIVPLLMPAAGFAAAEIVRALKGLAFGRLVVVAAPVAGLALLVNWFAVSSAAEMRLHPKGFADRSHDAVVIRDDSNYTTQFGAETVGTEARIVKFLIVDEPLAGLESAAVLLKAKVEVPGQLKVTLNGNTSYVGAPVADTKWMKVRFGAEAVKAGVNTIEVQGDGQVRAFVLADDVYRFGRSMYSRDGATWMRDNLDHTSYRYRPTLHIGGHEFKIRLELRYGGAAGAQ